MNQPSRNHPILVCVTSSLLLAGCAFNTKEYISHIVLDGPNHRGARYDEGSFYVNDDPSITIKLGCYKRTQLGESMSFLIPLPVSNVASPHESIANDRFALTLGIPKTAETSLADIKISVEIGGLRHAVEFDRLESERLRGRDYYHFTSQLTCAEVQNGVLRIPINQNTTREYGVHFEECERQEINYQMGFST